MFVNNWLRDLNNDVLPRIRPRRRPSRPHGASPGYCPRALAVEPLEDRSLLTALLVDTLADNPSAGAGDMDGLVSLREAVTAANTNLPFGDAPAGDGGGIVDEITFDVSLIGPAIVLGGVEMAITDDLSISGPGATSLTLSGDNASRVFTVNTDVSMELSGVTIANGSATDGGGIFNLGMLTLENSTLTGNTSSNSGGAIENRGTLAVFDGLLTNNSTAYYGGAIANNSVAGNAPSVTITNSTVKSNYSDYYQGGGIWSDGVTKIAYSDISENMSYSNGGGIWNGGTLDVVESTFSKNGNLSSGFNGGAIGNEYGGTVSVQDSVFSENSGSQGGAIINFGGFLGTPGTVDITDSHFFENSGRSGGALWTDGPMSIEGSTFTSNHATSLWGGAISNHIAFVSVNNSTFVNNTAALYSGAIDNTGASMEISNSLLSGNTAGREGGAIENYFASLKVNNTTISGNSTEGDGGGIWNLGTLVVANSTVTGNRADADGNGSGNGGGFFDDGSASLPIINNTIVTGNVRGTTGNDTPNDIVGLLDLTSRANLIGDAATSGGLADGDNVNIVGNFGVDTIDITTVLDANLADNGGSTLTHALVTDSLAIDAGDNNLAVDGDGNPLAFDQRGDGFTRIVGDAVDIGAYEVQPQIIEIEIDVKPGSDSNPINLASQGVIAVAIPTTDDFDAALVDVSTVVFAGATAVQSALEDVDGDGDLDLVLHFQVQDTNLADAYAQLLTEDPDSNHQSVAVSLGGETINDEVFAALDDVDLFLAGRALRELLEELAEAGAL